MPEVASDAHAASRGSAATQPRQHPPGGVPEAAHKAVSAPFASLIDRTAPGGGDTGAYADSFRTANRPADVPRRADDSRQADRNQADRNIADRKPAARRDDIRSAPDRRGPSAADNRNDVKPGERDNAVRADDDAAQTKPADKADSTNDDDATVDTQANAPSKSEAKPDDDTVDTADTGDADAIATAIDASAVDADKAGKLALAVTAAPTIAPAETDAAAAVSAETELAIDTGKPARPALALTGEDAVDTAEAATDGKPKTEAAADDTGSADQGAFDDALKAQQAKQGGDGKTEAEAKPAHGEAKPAAEAKAHHAAIADKAADGAPAPVANAHTAQSAQNPAQHSQIHVPQVQNAGPVAAAPATPASQQARPVPVQGLAVEIAAKALAGKNRFEIRLDPPELGRIDVRLDVDRHGQVTSRLVVDRPETLDLLRRDAAGLERALQDAGLKTTDNGLQFSLRDQMLNQQAFQQLRDSAEVIVSDETLPAETMQRGYRTLANLRGGVDIRV